MKKSLLMIGALAAGLSVGAQQSAKVLKTATPIPAVKYQAPSDIQFSQVYPQSNSTVTNTRHGNSTSTLSTNEAIVGSTKYPLQTNSSMPHRLWYNDDSTMSVVYTYAVGAWLTWSDRGTGYNYFDGSTWQVPSTQRIENGRTGFPDLIVLDNGMEMTVAHNTASSLMHFCSRAQKGIGLWTDYTSILPNPPGFGFYCLWPRMAVGGNSDVIHHIALTEPVANGGALYHGQDGCLLYSRSNDGGQTFAVQNQLLAPFDSTQISKGNGDAYAIDAMNNTVAIVVGGFGEDVVLAKSIDGGVTWTKTIVQDFLIPAPFVDQVTDTNNDNIADTLETNDGSLSVLIDNSGQVHVWYGLMFVLNDDSTDGTLSYFPGTAALMYWNESMGTNPPEVIAVPEDPNNDGVLNVTAFGTYQVGLLSHPSSGIDAAGNLYVAFSAILEGTDEGSGKSYRQVYMIKSTDNGANWSLPFNISPDVSAEKVYPTLARNVGSVAHVCYTQDQVAGHGVFTANNPDPDNVDNLHDIVCASLPTTDIVSVNEQITSLNSVEVYPNPANTTAHVLVNLAKSLEVTVAVYNSTGQMVSSQMKNLPAGATTFAVDVTNLATGIYFINVTEGTTTISKKLIVE
ncbi:MAG: T9SS type A sorting domain-containing protein [Bacteroidia bacterium]